MYAMKIIQPTGQLFGRTLRNIKLPGFELSEGLYNSNVKTPHHSHDWALLCLVIKGNYLERHGAKQFTRSFSTVFFHPAEESHVSDFRDTTVGIFQIEIEPRRLQTMDCMTRSFRQPMNFKGGTEVMLARKIYREFKWMDEVSPIAIEGLILEFLAAAARLIIAEKNRSKTPKWLRDAKDFLHDNFTESYSLDNIAAEVGIHPKYLATEFRRHFRLTIGEYLRHLRIEYTCRQMATSNASLVDIALSAGFSSQSHFNRTFKEIMGFTPVQYKKNLE
jgi:AraC family transcriptional regulator